MMQRLVMGVCSSAFLMVAMTHSAAAACPPPPAPISDLDIPRFYGDAKGSVIDPKQKAMHDAAVQPLSDFLQEVTSNADKSLRRTKFAERRELAQCTLVWLTTWARGDAWLGRMAQAQSEYQRKWDLAGAALAYVKVKSHATPEQRQVIEPWLLRFADAALGFFDDRRHMRNNHWYWLGMAVGATALATESDKHWTIARGIMKDAANDIAADGTLAREIARGGRAIHYHAFAVMPLIVLAELARAKGEDWYTLNGGALHRLVDVTIAGFDDPTFFDQRAGVSQQRPLDKSAGAGWLQLYQLQFAQRLGGRRLPMMKIGHRWIGGDVLTLDTILSGYKKTRG
jgi:poly(beta-D-mannuronate) lyase